MCVYVCVVPAMMPSHAGAGWSWSVRVVNNLTPPLPRRTAQFRLKLFRVYIYTVFKNRPFVLHHRPTSQQLRLIRIKFVKIVTSQFYILTLTQLYSFALFYSFNDNYWTAKLLCFQSTHMKFSRLQQAMREAATI